MRDHALSEHFGPDFPEAVVFTCRGWSESGGAIFRARPGSP